MRRPALTAAVMLLVATPALAQPARRRGRGEHERCPDPITGTWEAKVFRSDSAAWDRVTISVVRTRVQLSGWIWVDSWDGDAAQVEPPACPDGTRAVDTWRERMRGSLVRGVLELYGGRVRKLDGACAAPGSASTYRLDHFTGELAADVELMLLTNDDGGVDRDRPHHFRRVSCRP